MPPPEWIAFVMVRLFEVKDGVVHVMAQLSAASVD